MFILLFGSEGRMEFKLEVYCIVSIFLGKIYNLWV